MMERLKQVTAMVLAICMLMACAPRQSSAIAETGLASETNLTVSEEATAESTEEPKTPSPASEAPTVAPVETTAAPETAAPTESSGEAEPLPTEESTAAPETAAPTESSGEAEPLPTEESTAVPETATPPAEDADEAEPAPTEAVEAFVEGYIKVQAGTKLYAAASGNSSFVTLAEAGAVYAFEAETVDDAVYLHVYYACEGKIVKAWICDKGYTVWDKAAIAAYQANADELAVHIPGRDGLVLEPVVLQGQDDTVTLDTQETPAEEANVETPAPEAEEVQADEPAATETPTPAAEAVETLQANAELMLLSEDAEGDGTEETADVLVITVPETVEAGKDVSFSWTAVPGVKMYYFVSVDNADGESVWGTFWPADGGRQDALIDAYYLEGGSYRIEVRACVYNENGLYEDISSGDAYFEVVGEFAAAPTVTADVTNVVTDENVTFTIVAPGVTGRPFMRYEGTYSYSLLMLGSQYSIEGDTVTTSLSWSNAGEYAVSFRTQIGDTWTEYSEPIVISVSSKGALDAPVVSVPEELYAGESYTITWDSVPNAETYNVYIKAPDGRNSYSAYDIEETSLTIPEGALPPGTCDVVVYAEGTGWKDGSSHTPIDVAFAREGHEFGYRISNSYARITNWFAESVPATIMLPETLGGYPVKDINSDFFEAVDSATLVAPNFDYGYYVSDNMSLDATDITIVGWYGSQLHRAAQTYGWTFVPAEGSVLELTGEIPETINVGDRIEFSAQIQGVEEARFYEVGVRYPVYYSATITETGISKTWVADNQYADSTIPFFLYAVVNGAEMTSPVYNVYVNPLVEMATGVEFVDLPASHKMYTALEVSVTADPVATDVQVYLNYPDGSSEREWEWASKQADGTWTVTFPASMFEEQAGTYTLEATAYATGYENATATAALTVENAIGNLATVEQPVEGYDIAVSFDEAIGATGYKCTVTNDETSEVVATVIPSDEDGDGVFLATIEGKNITAGTYTVTVTASFDEASEATATISVEVWPLFENRDGAIRYNGWETYIEVPDTVDGRTISRIAYNFDYHRTVKRVKLPATFTPKSKTDVEDLIDLGTYRHDCVVEVPAGTNADFWRLYYNFTHWEVYGDYSQEPPTKPDMFYLGRNTSPMCYATSSGWIFLDAAGNKATTLVADNLYTAYWCAWSLYYNYVFSVCKPYTVMVKTPPPATITAPAGQVAVGAEVLITWKDPLASITTTGRDYTVTVTRDADGQVIYEGTTTGCQISAGVIEEKGIYTITLVQDIGETFEQTITQSFEVIDYLGTLDAPVITAPATALYGQSVTVTWEDPSDMAERFTIQLLRGTQVLQTAQATEKTCTLRMPKADGEQQSLELTIRVESQNALYLPGVAEIPIRAVQEYTYRIEDGKAIIVNYNGSDTVLKIPSTLGGYPVSGIDDSAFEGNTSIQSVRMPDTVISIGAKAFKDCTNLESVIGHGVTSVGAEAFSGCVSLKHLELGVLEKIGDDAFADVPAGDGLDIEIIVPSDAILEAGAFENNDVLGIVTYGEGVTKIPARAHYNNSHLGSAYLPSTLETIGSNAFAACAMLKQVYLYENVTDIADNAFSDTPNVAFTIYVYSMDTESYVEQYAKNHSIPYTKVLIAPSAPSLSINGNVIDFEFTVNVDEEVTLFVQGASAEKTIIYLDDQVIAEKGFRGGALTLPYVFTEIGDHHLYAVSCNGDLVSEKTLDKIVHVVNTTFSMDKDETWTCESVHFEVSSSVLSGVAKFYADDVLFAEVEVVDGKASLDYPFTKAGERQIHVSIGASISIKRQLTVNCIAGLEQPVVQAEPIQSYNDGLTFTWRAVEHADGYVVRAIDPSGESYYRYEVDDDGRTDYQFTVPLERLRGIGSYAVFVMAFGYQYNQSESEAVSVALIDQGIAFVLDKTQVQTCEEVSFVVVAPGATQVQLIVDAQYYETYELENGRVAFVRGFTRSGERQVAFRALVNGEWSEPCEAKLVTVTSLGQLDAPVVTAKPFYVLGHNANIEWTAVAQADGYIVYVLDADGNELLREETSATSLTIFPETWTACAVYTITVMAYGANYDQSRGTASTEVVERMPGPAIIAPDENVGIDGNSTEVLWKTVDGAESYVVSLAYQTDATDENGQPVFEKVWADPNQVINVGQAVSYLLNDLRYGVTYRVAVGAVYEGTGLDEESLIGWSVRVFTVAIPQLGVQLTAEPNPAYENQTVTIMALLDQADTAAVLSDGTTIYTPASNVVVEDGRSFTFNVTERISGTYTYTLIAKGTNELESAEQIQQTIDVTFLDANKPVVMAVSSTPETCWPNMDIAFSIETNAFTEKVNVLLPDGSVQTLSDYDYAFDNQEKRIFSLTRQFDSAGNYTLQFTPVNADGESGDLVRKSVTVLAKGSHPNPEIIGVSDGDILTAENMTISWSMTQLPEGMPFGGYTVILTEWNGSTWQLVPGQVYVGTGLAPHYRLPALTAGKQYKLEVYTLDEGKTEPTVGMSGYASVTFGYRTVPAFSLTSVTCGSMYESIVAKWDAPVWTDASIRPDFYVVYWVDPNGDVIDQQTLRGVTQSTLDGNKVVSYGQYGINVYACMYESWGESAGTHAYTEGKCVVAEPAIHITVPNASQNTYLVNADTVEVSGTIEGGVKQVLVNILDQNGTPVDLISWGDGSTIQYAQAQINADGTFYAKLQLKEHFQASEGDQTIYCVEARGYVSAGTPVIGHEDCADFCWIDTDDAELISFTINHYSPNYWLFAGQTMTARVTTNQLVQSVMLYQDGANKSIAFTRTENANKSSTFTSAPFSLMSEGLHVLSVRSDAGKTKQVNVYIVTALDEQTMYFSGEKSAVLRSGPYLGGTVRATLTEACEVTLLGSCGDYVYVEVNGQKGFMLRSALSKEAPPEEEEKVEEPDWSFKIEESNYTTWLYVKGNEKVLSGNYYLVIREDGAETPQLYTQAPITPTSNYTRSYRLDVDLELKPGHQYEFAVASWAALVAEEYPTDYPYSYYYPANQGLIRPYEGEQIYLWDRQTLYVEWYHELSAKQYTVTVTFTYTDGSQTVNKVVFNKTYDASGTSWNINAGDTQATRAIQIPAEELREQVPEDMWKNHNIQATVSVEVK